MGTTKINEKEQKLKLVLSGFFGLRDEGRFDEPNLDGTGSDYISFDSWEWMQGVGLYGLFRLFEHRRESALFDALVAWYEPKLANLPPCNVNTTAPMLALSFLHKENGRYQDVLDDWANEVMNGLPRTREGGFQHTVSDGLNPGQLWDDTLFMVCLFLAHWGEIAGRRELVDEAERQFQLHAKYLVDTKTGLWFHGWEFSSEGGHNFARALWARGNAWITAGIVDLMEMCTLSVSVKEFLLGTLEAQVHSLLKFQDESGAWHTLLDDPTSYLETSATGIFGYALLKGYRKAILDERARKAGLKALDYVLNKIDKNGVVQGVSYGTRMGRTLDFYKEIPIQPTGYGQASALLVLTEARFC